MLLDYFIKTRVNTVVMSVSDCAGLDFISLHFCLGRDLVLFSGILTTTSLPFGVPGSK